MVHFLVGAEWRAVRAASRWQQLGAEAAWAPEFVDDDANGDEDDADYGDEDGMEVSDGDRWKY